MRLLLPLVLLLSAGQAAAEDYVVISREDCVRLVERYEPAPNVAYQPGVDVEGRPVAPADLAPRIVAPDSIAIPITLDLATRLHSRFGMKAELGTVNYRDGQAFYNGQHLGDDGTAEIAVQCRKLLRRHRRRR